MPKEILKFEDVDMDEVRVVEDPKVIPFSALGDIEEAKPVELEDGRTFIPNEIEAKREVEAPGGVATFAMEAADKASFGLVGRTAALAPGIDYEDIKKAKGAALDANPVPAAIGGFLGYFINPAGRAWAGSKAAAGMSKGLGGIIGRNVMEALAVEGTEALVDVVAAGLDNKESVNEALLKGVKEVGMDAVAGIAIPFVGRGVVAPIKTISKIGGKSLVKGWSKAAKMWLGDSHKVLIDNAEQAIKENPDQYVKDVAKVFDDYRAGIKQTIKKAQASGDKELLDTALALEESVNRHSKKVVEGIVEPKASVEALAGVLDDVEVAHSALSVQYGHLMSQVDDAVKGVTLPPDKSASLLKDMVEMLEMEGSVVLKNGKLESITRSDYPLAVKAMNRLMSKKALDHSDLREMSQSLNRPWSQGVSTQIDSQAKFLKKKMLEAVGDESVWGKEAAQTAQAVQGQYDSASKAFQDIRKNVSKGSDALAAMQEDPGNLISHLQDVQRTLQNVNVNMGRLGTSKQYGKILPEALQKRAKIGVEQARELLVFDKARDVKKAKKVINDFMKGKKDPTEESDLLLDAIQSYRHKNVLFDTLDNQLHAMPKLKNAVKNPLSKANREAAEQYAEEYAKLLGPESKKIIDASAKWHRIAGVKPGIKNIDETAEVLKGIVSKTDLIGAEIMADIGDDAVKLLKRAPVAKALAELNPSLAKAIKGKPGLDEAEVASWLLGGKWGTAVLMAIRIGKDPAALRLFTEKMSKAGLSMAQQKTLLQASRVATAIATEMTDE